MRFGKPLLSKTTMDNMPLLISISIIYILLREGTSSLDYSVLQSPSKKAITMYRAKLSRYWDDGDIQLFLSKYIDYTFPMSVPAPTYKGSLTTALDETSTVSNCASFGIGRLGNQMCNIASQYALFKKFGIGSFISNYSYTMLKETFTLNHNHSNDNMIFFKRVTANDFEPNKLSWIYVTNTDMIYKRINVFKTYRYSWFFKLEPNICDFKGFLPYIQNIRNGLFRFNPNVMQTAKSLLRHNIDNALTFEKNVTFVSIHVRLTDMEEHAKLYYNLSIPSKDYFSRAMLHVQERLGSGVIFVAFSDDMKRAKTILLPGENQNFKIIFPDMRDITLKPSVVLAMLSLAQGSILTYGTFGLWGALLRRNLNIIIAPKEFLNTKIGFYLSTANIKRVTYK